MTRRQLFKLAGFGAMVAALPAIQARKSYVLVVSPRRLASIVSSTPGWKSDALSMTTSYGQMNYPAVSVSGLKLVSDRYMADHHWLSRDDRGQMVLGRFEGAII